MPGRRVLLVDDDPDVVATLEAMLEAAGYEVVAAHSAQEAIARLPLQVDLAILDLMMEENDSGAQVALELRRRPETKHVPIILLTAAAEKTGFRVALDSDAEREWLGADVWLDKPVTPERLYETIAEVGHEDRRGGA